MDVTAKIIKIPETKTGCQHIIVEFTDGETVERRSFTVDDLVATSPTSLVDAMPDVEKLFVSACDQLEIGDIKTTIEKKVFKI